jgi:hypothetical protein
MHIFFINKSMSSLIYVQLPEFAIIWIDPGLN